MGFYQHSKEERSSIVLQIQEHLSKVIIEQHSNDAEMYFADEDTYIRKTAYLAIGKLYAAKEIPVRIIIDFLNELALSSNEKIRQTVINAAGEIGKKDFAVVQHFFDTGLFDAHHAPRNAVIGSMKKMAEVNPQPVLQWAATYLQHPDKEIRREICHGIELRGRKYPADILPLLAILQHDKTARVRNTLIHVLGQIAYKKGCLPIVLQHLEQWENRALVKEAIKEIIDVHHRYRNFSALTQVQAISFVDKHYSHLV